jgi:hypothetical protein
MKLKNIGPTNILPTQPTTSKINLQQIIAPFDQTKIVIRSFIQK